MVVMDNGATVTSGFQTNPGVGRDALGRPAPALSIERIARACGVEWVRSVAPRDAEPATDPALRDAFREALARRGPALLVVRTPCGSDPRFTTEDTEDTEEHREKSRSRD
jgi:indolepyruvate ferredoxin oxidoreductase, alpha subunit